jgi:hypothetical protein
LFISFLNKNLGYSTIDIVNFDINPNIVNVETSVAKFKININFKVINNYLIKLSIPDEVIIKSEVICELVKRKY